MIGGKILLIVIMLLIVSSLCLAHEKKINYDYTLEISIPTYNFKEKELFGDIIKKDNNKSKTFGYSLYKDIKNAEKKARKIINNIVIPEMFKEYMKIDLKIKKEFKIKYVYTYKF